MTLSEAIATLQKLVGCESLVKFEHGPVRVVAIDFYAGREQRCILGRVGDDSPSPAIRRPVVDITYQTEYHNADRLIADTSAETIRETLGV